MKPWQYYKNLFKQNKRWIRLAAEIIIIGFLIGLVAVFVNTDAVLNVLRDAFGYLETLATDSQNTDDLGRVFIIWQNNLMAAGMMLFLGFFLGYIPFVSLLTNGLLIGALLSLAIKQGLNILTFFLLVVPHGIIEIPAVIVSAAFGIKLGWAWLLPSARGKRKKTLNDTVIEILSLLGLIALLLLISAVIEGVFVYRIAAEGLGSLL